MADDMKEEEKKEVSSGSELKYNRGNVDDVVVTLLLQIAQKLDNMQNHTETIVDSLQDILKEMEDNAG